MPGDDQRYAPIRDYAALGDCHGAALVSRAGSIDWCCLGRFDADPVFCRLLDADRGGFLELRPEVAHEASRAYLKATNILRTTFTTPAAQVTLTDFMPLGRAPGAGVHDYVTLNAPHWLVRLVECSGRSVPLRVRYRPTVDFGRRRPALVAGPGRLAVEGGPCLFTDIPLSVDGDSAEGVFDVRPGQSRHLVVAPRPGGIPPDAEHLARLQEVTRAFWEEWVAYCRYRGPHGDAVLRSALALKLLTYAPTGALVAAATTSLPEEIDGERNWDYRYCWVRDATFVLYALGSLGYSGEARRFAAYLTRACKSTHPRVQIMYGVGGETDLTEHALDHLDGYRHSRPVRTGNAAHAQEQFDVYGEVLDWALLYRSLGGRFNREERRFLASMSGYVADHWQEPDQGLWEMRGPPRQHVHSKVMAWVGLDRALRLFGPQEGLRQARDAVARAVREQGVHPREGHLLQTLGGSDLDAALLLVPLLGFPVERRVIEATVDAIQGKLRRGDFLKRYTNDDGVRGGEGAFLPCSFWLVDSLLLLDRPGEARDLFERLLACANDVGLYAEEIDPESRAFLGNFPQALSHLALIHSANHLALYERHGAGALAGTHADRARYTVEAAAGPWALWAAFKRSGRVGRLWSARASILPPN